MPPKRGGKAPAFPAARVKRIMQQDDEVGKVATASPIVMAKATELFLYEMLDAVEREARAKSTKKVSLYHVKRAVENTPSLDFLKDLVSSIPDPSGADEEYESSEKVPKKRAARGKAGANGGSTSGLGETGSASPVPASASAHASASTSTSASGLKKIKISHSASAAKAESTEDATPSTSASTFSLPPMPIPQDSRPNVAIPISSLLSDTVTDYGPEDGQGQFNSAPKEEEIGHWNTVQTTTSKAAEDDDYDNEESKGSASMQLDQTTAVPAEQAQASAAPEAATYKREEDEDYDAE